ncbi:MAG: hypothetical protein R2838_19935 [Caldilineaceae bacterium]
MGELLNPRQWSGGEETLGLPIHDNWWQTETGGIMIANYPVMDIRPGSMGKPLPGIEADPGEAGGRPRTRHRAAQCPAGRMCWRCALAVSMFRGYLHDDERAVRNALHGRLVPLR